MDCQQTTSCSLPDLILTNNSCLGVDLPVQIINRFKTYTTSNFCLDVVVVESTVNRNKIADQYEVNVFFF